MANGSATIPKLIDLSTFCVIDNFEKFMIAYKSCNDVQKKNFEYLQRARSKVVLKHLSKERAASKYKEFLLNPFLKDVNLKACVWDHRTVVKQLLVISKTIKKLYLFEYRCFPNLLNLVCQMQHLESLTLHCSVVSQVLLQNIGKYCTSLKMLNLSATNVTDNLIEALCVGNEERNSTIERLDLSKTPVTFLGIYFILQHFPNLLYLQHKNVVEALTGMPSLSAGEIILSHSNIFKLKNLHVPPYEVRGFCDDVLELCRSLCPNVSELSVRSVKTKTQLDAIAEFTALTKVKICGQKRTFIDLSSFLEARGRNLEVLVIKNSSISAELLPKFCPKLQFLKLENIHFNPLEQSWSMTEKHIFPHLKMVTLEYMDFTIDSVTKSTHFLLSCAPNLEKLKFLSIFSFKLDFIDIFSIHSSLKNVQELVIVNSDITASEVKTLLSTFPHLKKFTLSGTSISLDDYMIMKELRPSLRIITDHNDISICPIANNADDTDSESYWNDSFEDGYSSDDDDESWTDISDYDLSDAEMDMSTDDSDLYYGSSLWPDDDTSMDDNSWSDSPSFDDADFSLEEDEPSLLNVDYDMSSIDEVDDSDPSLFDGIDDDDSSLDEDSSSQDDVTQISSNEEHQCDSSSNTESTDESSSMEDL